MVSKFNVGLKSLSSKQTLSEIQFLSVEWNELDESFFPLIGQMYHGTCRWRLCAEFCKFLEISAQIVESAERRVTDTVLCFSAKIKVFGKWLDKTVQYVLSLIVIWCILHVPDCSNRHDRRE